MSVLFTMKNNKLYLYTEFSLIYILFPIILYYHRHTLGRFLIPGLLIASVAVIYLLRKDPGFDRNLLPGKAGPKNELLRVLYIFIPNAFLIAGLTYLFLPDLFLAFPRRIFRMWLMIIIMYPLFSVYPQELIFRTWFFHRYRFIFPNKYIMIGLSGFTFGLAHLFFGNYIAPLMSMAGGFLFAKTYYRSCSTLLCAIEHAIWGDFIFTVGLGYYFYHGNIS